MSDPGYLSPEYKHPLTPEKFAPLKQLRTHNMKVFAKYNLYDFSQEQSADDENSLITEASHGDTPLKPINRKISDLDAVSMADH